MSKKGLYLYLVFITFFFTIMGLFLPEGATTREQVPGLLKSVRDIAFILLLYVFVVHLILTRESIQMDRTTFLLVCFYVSYVLVQSLRFFSSTEEMGFFGLSVAVRNALEYVPLLFMAQIFIKSKPDMVKLTRFIIVLAVVLAVYGIVQSRFGYKNALYAIADESGAAYRVSGSLNNPSMFAIAVDIGIVLLVSQMSGYTFRRQPKLLAACFVVCLLMFLASATSYSVTGVVALLCGLGFLLGFRKRGKLYIGFIFISIIVATMFVFSSDTRDIFKVLSGISFSIRLQIWEQSLKEILLNPVIGYGTGSFGSSAGTLKMGHITDNYYVSLLLQQGVIGLVLFLLIIQRITKKASVFMKKSRDAEMKNIIRGYCACVIVILTANLSGDFCEVFPINVWFWLLLGVLVKCPYLKYETGFSQSMRGCYNELPGNSDVLRT